MTMRVPRSISLPITHSDRQIPFVSHVLRTRCTIEVVAVQCQTSDAAFIYLVDSAAGVAAVATNLTYSSFSCLSALACVSN